MRHLSKIVAITVLVLSAMVAIAQNASKYKILNGKVYYNNVILHEADPNTIRDLGYGYAKDKENVWLDGKLLPLVDARSFRLKNSPTPPPPPSPSNPLQSAGSALGNVISGILGVGATHKPPHHNGGNPVHEHIQQESGYEIIGTKVYYNGTVVGNASAHSFKDLGRLSATQLEESLAAMQKLAN